MNTLSKLGRFTSTETTPRGVVAELTDDVGHRGPGVFGGETKGGAVDFETASGEVGRVAVEGDLQAPRSVRRDENPQVSCVRSTIGRDRHARAR